jgi:hypothetical protein
VPESVLVPPLELPLEEPLLDPELLPELLPLEPPLDEPLLEPLLDPELLPLGCTPFGAEEQQTAPCPAQGYGSVPTQTRPLPGATQVPPDSLHTLPSALPAHARTVNRPRTRRIAIARRMAGTLVCVAIGRQ